MKTILLISPYWKEPHRWMVSSYKLAELWQKMGYRVVAVCMGNLKNGKLVETVSESLEIHRMQDVFLKDPWNYGIAFGFTRYVKKLIAEKKPDYIIANKILFWTSLSVIALRLAGHRVTLLTDAFVGMTWWPRGRVPKLCAAIYAWTLGWLIMLCARRIVTFHPQPERLLKRLWIGGKTEVIPTGIDVDNFKFKISNLKLDQGNQKLTITYVGRLESVKGVDDFLAAADQIKHGNPEVKIQVVGFYEEGHPLVKKYERSVSFTGLRDDIPEILSATDIFVLPSHSEGLSNALMEAMSSGCACIATDVGGNRFLIQNGVSGLLYPAGDRKALEAHIQRLLDDPAKRKMLAEKARERIENTFDWKVVSKQYKALFDRL